MKPTCAKCGGEISNAVGHVCPASYMSGARTTASGRAPIGETTCTICGGALPSHVICERVRRLEKQVAELRGDRRPIR